MTRAQITEIGRAENGGYAGWGFDAEDGPVDLGFGGDSFMGWPFADLELISRVAGRYVGDPTDLLILVNRLGRNGA